MVGAFFKFVLPISVTGTGIATALNSSNTSSEKGNVPSGAITTSVTNSIEQSPAKTSLPMEKLVPALKTPAASSMSGELPEETRQGELHTLKTEMVDREEEINQKGNCDIDESMTSILRTQDQKEQDYYSVTCTNEGIDGKSDTSFQNRWGGAFPKTLFVSKDWTSTKKLEIKVKTDFPEDEPADENYPNEIKFWSPQFNSTENSVINGNWDYKEDLDAENNTGAIVKLNVFSGLSNVYLLLDLDQKVD